MDVAMRPEVANTYKVFRIDNDDVLGLFGWKNEGRKYYSFDELAPHLDTLMEKVQSINDEASLRTTYEQQLNKLYQSLHLYDSLLRTFTPGANPETLELEYATWFASIDPGVIAINAQAMGREFNGEALDRFTAFADRYLQLAKVQDIAVLPPLPRRASTQADWSNLGQGLLDVITEGEIHPLIAHYAELATAYRNNDAEAFNTVLASMQGYFKGTFSAGKLTLESFLNNFQPFYISCVFYIASFVLVCLGWLFKKTSLRTIAYIGILTAFAIHTFGLFARMYIQGRPPVTNLYASAIFVGWGAVALGCILEKVHKNGLGTAISGLVGFATLIIAHNLGLSGDTLEMVRAVLDSNFWLSTHVVVVTLGYSAMFLAGALGIIYVFGRAFFRKAFSEEYARSLCKMAYGVIAFATIFSFVGTMLGGVWADQSWGRFWGWDPKENGALLIVLWCAIILHARWAGLVGNRGFMVMTVLGNIVTSWSWFGTNMLNVGLHSYGFMDKAFLALVVFMLSQLLIAGLAFRRNA